MALHAWRSPGDPSVHGTLEIDATEAQDVVRQLRARSVRRITITHLIGHALALAIRERPEVNAIIRLGNVYRRETIDVFFQIAFEGGEDLNGAKIARADQKSLVEIAAELEGHARSVRERRTDSVRIADRFRRMPAALTGVALRATTFLTYDVGLDLSRYGVPFDAFGSAMVTNVGSFGLTTGLAPLVPFSRCPIVLLVGEIHDRPVVRQGKIVARPILPIGVTFDHRLLDGYQASKMALRFRTIIEQAKQAFAHELLDHSPSDASESGPVTTEVPTIAEGRGKRR
jgi:pyruvate/2-oxoglutarate dehydrogenase complex dihydrolipoamide acyltransferase (E2) component